MTRPDRLDLAIGAVWGVLAAVLLEMVVHAQDVSDTDVEALAHAVEALVAAKATEPTTPWGPLIVPVLGPALAVVMGLIGYRREQDRVERAKDAREAAREAKSSERLRNVEVELREARRKIHHQSQIQQVITLLPQFRGIDWPRIEEHVERREPDSDGDQR